MFSYKSKSHPGILLKDHLENVGNRCKHMVESKDISFCYSKELLCKVAEVIGYCHDLGKATSYFQKYLEDMQQYGKSDVDKTLKSHGFISAIYTYVQLKDIDSKLALIAFVIVRKHHGNLENSDMEYNFDSKDLKRYSDQIKKQVDAINVEELENIFNFFGLENIDKNQLISGLDEIYDNSFDFMEDINENKSLEDYILYKFLFSILIFSDKEDAIFHKENNIDFDIPYDLVDSFKEKEFKDKKSALGDIRNSIYDDVKSSINNVSSRIMSITVPTGTGKTLTALSAALNLKKKINMDMKIIYCLPFTSVIDQNYGVYADIIEKVMGKDKLSNNRLLKHHHLVELNYLNEKNDYKSNESKFLIENWNSQIVVTTFIQFFNTVFSSSNSNLVKYNSLSNSIILLDEVQSIPHKYWKVIDNIFTLMAEKLNIYFILITATQPLIFGKYEIVELVDHNEKYFGMFKRTKMHINLEGIQYEDFLDKIDNIISINEDKSVLIILNTVKLAQKVFKYIKEKELSDVDMFFLTTSIVPKHRQDRIQRIKDSKKRRIVVSTQMIEAGVDIDMDIVIRDLAPLDSINQSAGRCNREYRGDYDGDVYIVNIVDDRGKEVNSYIYDHFLIDKTKEVLKDKEIICEEDYLEINNEYFQIVSKNMSNDVSRNLIDYINKTKFKDVEENFKLIESHDKVSVFIEVDEDASNTWNKYIEICKEKDLLKKKEAFDKIKKDFYGNVITVFKNKIKEDVENGIMHINKDSLINTYDGDMGYMAEDKDVIL